MSWQRKGLNLLVFCIVAIILISIAQSIWRFDLLAKTVQWEEEVPLNTGEVIWVKRKVEYTLQGDAGNPFDIAYRPTIGKGSVHEFNWNGKSYRFDLDVLIVLIALSPTGQLVLVGEGDYWNRTRNYACTTPLYVQFVPDASGQHWTWPPKIESWLYNLKSNRLFETPTPGNAKQRFTSQEIKAANGPGIAGSISRQKINPAHTGDLCKSKEK